MFIENMISSQKIQQDSILILDLDDTIFETKSIPVSLVNPAITHLLDRLEDRLSHDLLKSLAHDLWRVPVDQVISKYDITTQEIESFYHQVESIILNPGVISPYEDYPHLLALDCKMYLVTSGLKMFQHQKIKALGIEEDFKEIYVDDPRDVPRPGKKGIIDYIMADCGVQPDMCWVIGDNPSSEIQAGASLGCRTIQRKSSSKNRSMDVDYFINSFAELAEILI